MTIPQLLLMACFASAAGPGEQQGAIGGIVVHASNRAPVGGADVVLRIEIDGQFVPLAKTTADEQGKFLFHSLPVGEGYLYLPGANRDDVHYPGPRVRLTPERSQVGVKLEVRDATTGPNPLVARRHEVIICPEPGALTVTETILVDNPTSKCYVGQAAGEDAGPVTLRLAVPPDFERATFHEEFFGRRFSMVDGKMVTGVPWQPGQREVKLTYVLPNSEHDRLWKRPLDLACSDVRVRVQTARPSEVFCNLEPGTAARDGEIVFESRGKTLPAGYVIRVELGRLPVPFMVYGRWLALAALVGLVAAATLAALRRRRDPEDRSASDGPSSRGRTNRRSISRHGAHSAPHSRKRKASARRRG